MKTADPNRPWTAVESGGVHYVARSRRGDSTAEERYSADTLTPLLLDKRDADALLQALNLYKSARTPPDKA